MTPPEHDPKAPLRGKICGLCEQSLERARKGECAAIWLRHEDCYWVHALRAYSPSLALKMSGGKAK
jgi:hypothetical protein